MREYIVKFKDKSLLRKNGSIVKADNFIESIISSKIVFVDNKDKNVAMFDKSDVESIVTREDRGDDINE